MQAEELALAKRFKRTARPGSQNAAEARGAVQAAESNVAPPDLTPGAFAANDLRALATAVSYGGLPTSGLSVAALLESRGWTDADAHRLFGCADVVALGHQAWAEAWLTADPERAAQQGSQARAVQGARSGSLHLRGLYFLVLVFVPVVVLVLSGFSFSAGSGLTLVEATAVALGGLLGLVWANSFSQLLARDPWSLYLQHDAVLAGLAAFRIIGLALGLAVGLAAAAVGLCLASTPPFVATVGLGVVYFLLVAMYWLWVNALLVLDLGPAMLISTMAGLAGMTFVRGTVASRLGPAAVPAIGLALANLLMGLVAALWWAWWHRRALPTRPLPCLAGTAISQLTYLVYGCGIMLLLILDRLIAWITGAQAGFLAIQIPYEVGSSWALLAFLLAMVGQEWLLASFLLRLQDQMHRHALTDLTGYRRAIGKAYGLQLALGAFIATASGTAIAWLVSALSALPWLQPLVPSGEGLFVLRWSLVGYCLLAVALLNTGLFVGLSRPNRVMLPLALALVADLAVGWTAAQATTYAASVLGLVAGSAVLLVFSIVQVPSLLRTPAYCFYLDG